MSKETADSDTSPDNVNLPIAKSNHSLTSNTKMFILPPNVLQNICITDSMVKGGSIVSALEILKRDNSAINNIIAQGQKDYEISTSNSFSNTTKSNVKKPTTLAKHNKNKLADDTDNTIVTNATKVPKINRNKGKIISKIDRAKVDKSADGASASPKELCKTKCTIINVEKFQTTSNDVPKLQKADMVSEQCNNERSKRARKQIKLDDYVTTFNQQSSKKKGSTPKQRRKSSLNREEKQLMTPVTSVSDIAEANDIVNDKKSTKEEKLQTVPDEKGESSISITPAVTRKSLPSHSSNIIGDRSSIKNNEHSPCITKLQNLKDDTCTRSEDITDRVEVNTESGNKKSVRSVNTSVHERNKQIDTVKTDLELEAMKKSNVKNIKNINENNTNQVPNTISNSLKQESLSANSRSQNHSDQTSSTTPQVKKRGRPRKINPAQVPDTTGVMERSVDASQKISNVSTAETVAHSKRHSEKSCNISSNNVLSDDSNTEDVTPHVIVVRKRGRPLGSRNRGKRSRGRGRGSTYSALDTEYIPKTKGPISTEKTEHEISVEITEASDMSEVVICATCEVAVPKKQWNSHNLVNHNYMSWRKGDEPLDFENDKKLWRRVLLAALKKRKGVLYCEKCGDVKRSANGFISHMQFCGKSEDEKKALLVRCRLCSAVMMPSSLEIHERSHKQWEQNASKDVIPETERTKRKAAEKAVSKILEFTELVKNDNSHPEKKIKLESSLLKNVIKPPELKKKIPGIWKSRWKKELVSHGTITCRQIGCSYTCASFEEICKHFSECNFVPQECYTCKICKYCTATDAEMIKHVTETHTTSEGIDKCPDFVADNSSSDESKDISYTMNFLDKEKMRKLRWSDPYFPAIHWSMEFEENNYEICLFNDYTPNNFTLLNNKEAAEYFPELEVSMHTKQGGSESETLHDGNISWKQWNRFEGGFDEGTAIFFVGGPVWALSWLPVPSPMYSKNPSQYVAISTHPTMEGEYAIGKAYSGPNIIQIWNVGPLNYETDDKRKSPVLSYAITHNSGTVWCLEWCPSGCYQDESLNNYSIENETQSSLRRMGMLAAACSDGNIHVYSLPFPEELEFKKTKDNEWPIYSTDPVMTLVVNISIHDKNDKNWQCTQLSWTKEHGHNTIAAGFSNGYIALWDLANKTPLTVQKRQCTYVINAFEHFHAHGNAVSMVTLIPYNGQRFLASGSLDRLFKFWNLENTETPQTTIQRGIIVNGAWMTHWPCAVVSFDDALGYKHTHTYLIPIREYEFKYYPVLATNSPTYGLSVSDYGNSIAHGSLAGEILTLFPHELVQGKDLEKALLKRRRISSFVDIVDFSETKHDSKTNEKKDKKSSKEYHYMPDTYNECKDRFGIIFHDCLKSVERSAQNHSQQSMKLSEVPIEEYPFMSVNRISWNPNVWSYLWLVAGYQNGLVRLLNFKYMSAERELETLLPKHVERVLNKAKTAGR